MSEDINDFVSGLANQRLITLVVGEADKQETFYVQEIVLRSISDVLSEALNNEHLVQGEPGVVKLQDDDVDAWKVFLYRAFRRTLPDQLQNEDLMARCWTLGEKYINPQFQDLVMLELLNCLYGYHPSPSTAVVAAEGSPPGSKLRLLMADVLAHDYGSMGRFAAFQEALSVVGFAAECLEALADREGIVPVEELGERNRRWRSDVWKEYMVSEGPVKHWVHNTRAEGEAEEDTKEKARAEKA